MNGAPPSNRLWASKWLERWGKGRNAPAGVSGFP